MIEVAGNLIEAEVLGNTVHTPRSRARLERTDEQLAGIVFVIGASVVVAQHRQARVQAFDRFEQRVVVLAGVQRHVDADARRKIAGPHTGTEHDVSRSDIAARRRNAGDRAAVVPDCGYERVLEDFRAVAARTLRERLADVDRVGVTVRRDQDAAEQIVTVDERVALDDLFGRNRNHLEVEDLRHRRAATQFLEALLVSRNGNRTALAITGCLTGFGLQPVVEFARVFGELGHVDRRTVAGRRGRPRARSCPTSVAGAPAVRYRTSPSWRGGRRFEQPITPPPTTTTFASPR